jgi:hypothetical protein
MDNEHVVLVHNGILLSQKKNEILSFAGKWMELEDIILGEGQPGSEDQKSYVLPHIRTLDLGQIQQCDWTWIT